jgi:hypothetical protein
MRPDRSALSGQALAAIRRDEVARAHATWSELISERGIAAAREALSDLLEDEYMQVSDQEWLLVPSETRRQRARRALLRHGLAPN